MKYRKLRIAWSAFFGILCLLLIVLWVRSFYAWDEIHGRITNDRAFQFYSTSGRIAWYAWHMPRHSYPLGIATFPMDKQRANPFPPARPGVFKYVDFHAKHHANFTTLAAPHWSLVLIGTTLGALPWIRWRFSLRTLLFAMTVIAVVLGAVIWAAK